MLGMSETKEITFRFSQLFTTIQTKIEEDLNLEAAEKDAQILYEQGLQLANKEFSARGNIHFPLPFALKSIEILSSDSIQFCDFLKKALSLTSCLFIELTLLKSKVQNRNIYKETRTHVIDKIDKVISTVPNIQITTRFQLECCKAAIMGMEPGAGVLTEIAREHSVQLLKGVVLLATLNPSGLISPLIDLNVSLFNEVKNFNASWYPKIWKMKSYFYQVTNVVQLEKNEDLKKLVQKHNKKDKYAICLAEVFMNIIRNSKLEDKELKKRLFDEGNENFPSLCSLAEIKKSRTSFWRARHLAISNIITLSERGSFKEGSTKKLIERFSEETNPFVQNLLLAAYRNSTDTDRQIWNEKLEKIDIEDIESEDKKIKLEIQEEIQTIQKEQNENENLAKILKYSKTGQGDEAAYDTGPSEEEIKNIERKEKKLHRNNEQLKEFESELLEQNRDMPQAQKSKLNLLRQIQKIEIKGATDNSDKNEEN